MYTHLEWQPFFFNTFLHEMDKNKKTSLDTFPHKKPYIFLISPTLNNKIICAEVAIKDIPRYFFSTNLLIPKLIWLIRRHSNSKQNIQEISINIKNPDNLHRLVLKTIKNVILVWINAFIIGLYSKTFKKLYIGFRIFW